jgi:hypothetical protein
MTGVDPFGERPRGSRNEDSCTLHQRVADGLLEDPTNYLGTTGTHRDLRRLVALADARMEAEQ